MSGSIARKTITVMAAFARERERERERERGSERARDQESDGDDLVEALSAREVEVLHALARGRLYKEIADEQGVSYHTVRAHVRSIYRKLQVTSRREAINLARRRPGSGSGGSPPVGPIR
jgi:DNA-binding NarL/FixJ family response regulator